MKHLTLTSAAGIRGRVLIGVWLLCAISAGSESPDLGDPGLSRGADSSPAPETGVASYYADKYHGKQTASGEVFDMHQLTAAHPRLVFGTRVRVTHVGNQRSVLVRINDRGPFIKGRVIDLSLAAAQELDMVRDGLAQVILEVVRQP
jgi:rare lipoprotein A